jgi:nucleotide-binding universal stress UspA family protein
MKRNELFRLNEAPVTHDRRILIPIRLPNSSFDALLFAKAMSEEAPVCLTLLNVVGLNVACESRAYDEMCLESENELRKIGENLFGHHDVTVHVRVGKPSDQIAAEAESARADLILLSSPSRPRWKRWLDEGTVKGVIRLARCPTLVLPRVWNAMPQRPNGAVSPVESMASHWFAPAAA